jgi:hypothetical protein
MRRVGVRNIQHQRAELAFDDQVRLVDARHVLRGDTVEAVHRQRSRR